ncbi:HK97 gp10 family phage protein [Pelagibacterium sediminicola]|uniref:HK97 gp10 family phage protein n=1 Tax=Pelagibacterium sediminicola TaxID=2248761 RepID=UPI000E3136CA|nr:HK97 gp10 family phage protein [Pelagibacterium sediminicola]
MSSFSDQIAAFARKTEAKIETAIRKIALDVFSEVILKSPVDTGRFRGNWQVAIGDVPTGTLEVEDKTGTVTIGKVQAEVLNLKAGDTIYLVNNLPYALPLEYGHSGQAPEGMVRITVQRFKPIVEAVARELNKQ